MSMPPRTDSRIGLQDLACGKCHARVVASHGEACPRCGAPNEFYGPIFFGRKRTLVDHCDDPDPAKWTLEERWVVADSPQGWVMS